MIWRTKISTPDGDRLGIAPLVISASRATDIPAFHAAWFMHRLRVGYCRWQNPFNAVQRQYVSFSRCKVVVFWSKNPQPLMTHLAEMEDRGLQYYFQYTLNDYEQEGLEPRVPPLAQRMATFRHLAERVGRHRVVWRFDPIILGASLTVESILERVERLARELAPYTEKMVFSFVDWYAKTRQGLRRCDSRLRPPTAAEMLALAQGIAQMNRGLPVPLTLATCAEALDLTALGIAHNACIDPALLLRLCPHDPDLVRCCGQVRPTLVPLPQPAPTKDKGQRHACGCVPSKDIGGYTSCPHLCAYCYANASPAAVARTMENRDALREML